MNFKCFYLFQINHFLHPVRYCCGCRCGWCRWWWIWKRDSELMEWCDDSDHGGGAAGAATQVHVVACFTQPCVSRSHIGDKSIYQYHRCNSGRLTCCVSGDNTRKDGWCEIVSNTRLERPWWSICQPSSSWCYLCKVRSFERIVRRTLLFWLDRCNKQQDWGH